jgi:hypothetical protein
MRVYSSPKPTQPDSSTIGEDSSRPQNRTASDAGGEAAGGSEACAEAAFMGGLSPIAAAIAAWIA